MYVGMNWHTCNLRNQVELRDPQIPYGALEEIEMGHQVHHGVDCVGDSSSWGVGVGFSLPGYNDWQLVDI
jgi:hypothetical protein